MLCMVATCLIDFEALWQIRACHNVGVRLDNPLLSGDLWANWSLMVELQPKAEPATRPAQPFQGQRESIHGA